MEQAIVVRETGGPEVLRLEEIPGAEPGPGEVAVEVGAAGVNFIDIYQRSGVYQVPLPFVLGLEGAGRVTALGHGVTDLRVGDRVAWASVQGSYATGVTGPAWVMLPVPDGVDDLQAAALPLQGLTAHYLATDSYPISPGDTVLVHAGAGGVGLLLTQIAKIKGATVVTTVSSPAKAELSRQAGADRVIVGYGDVPAIVREVSGGEGAAAVYDGVGRDTFDDSLASLRIRGTLVLFGGASGQVPPFDLQRLNAGGSLSVTRPTLVHFTRTRAELTARAADLFGWLADGALTVRVGATYPLAAAGRAQQDLQARRTTGKVVLLTG